MSCLWGFFLHRILFLTFFLHWITDSTRNRVFNIWIDTLRVKTPFNI